MGLWGQRAAMRENVSAGLQGVVPDGLTQTEALIAIGSRMLILLQGLIELHSYYDVIAAVILSFVWTLLAYHTLVDNDQV